MSKTIFVEWKVLKHGAQSQPIAYFSDKSINQSDFYGTEYWLLSFATLKSIFRRLGFENFAVVDDPSQKRGILIASNDTKNFDFKDQIRKKRMYQRLLEATKSSIKLFLDAFNGTAN